MWSLIRPRLQNCIPVTCARRSAAVPPLPQRRYLQITSYMHYEPGFKLQIRHHQPPPPPSGPPPCFFGGEEWTRRQRMTLPQLSDDYPPAKGGRLGPPIELSITAAVRTGKAYHSQVVRVDVPTFPEKERGLVAKFYDPFQAESAEDPELNNFWIADQQYADEAAAYSKLTSIQSTLVPRFFGSYTCELPTGLGNNTRSIRLILLEFVEGVIMTSYSEDVVRSLPQTARKNIMYKVVDAESRAYALGVRHYDIHPRNIILELGPQHDSVRCTEDTESHNELLDPALRLRLFDFGQAKVAPFEAGVPDLFRGHKDKAVSPILRWHVQRGLQGPFEEAGWIDWDWQEWMKDRWGNSTFYEPITRGAEKAWLLSTWSRVLPDDLPR